MRAFVETIKTKPFWAISLALIVVPLAVDDRLSLEVGPYSLRLTYLGALLWVLGEAFEALKNRSINTFGELFLRRENWAFALMLIAPLAVFVSGAIAPMRSAAFTVWSIGTLIAVPWIARRNLERLGSFALQALFLYFGAQALIILYDSIVCGVSANLTLGRVMFYNHMGHGLQICRASAFYQEPGYFSATASIVALYLQRSLESDENPSKLDSRIRQLGMIVIIAALFACFSRLGWVLGAGISILEGLRIFKTRVKTAPAASSTRRMPQLLSWVAIATVIAIFVFKSAAIRTYLAQPTPKNDASIATRAQSIEYALEIYNDHPLVGVGPGAAGTYNATHWPERYKDTHVEDGKNRPVAMSLYPELLSEWGLVGTLFFFLGFALFFAKIDSKTRWPLLAIMLIVYTSTQTLPRFDLWYLLGIGSLSAFGRPRRTAETAYLKTTQASAG